MSNENLPPIKIAYVIDNEVVDIVHADERLAAIFLSNPTLIDVTDGFYDDESLPTILIGATYNQDNNTFTNPTKVE